MKVSLQFTNVIGNQPKGIEAEKSFMDFSRDVFEIRGLATEDARLIYKKVWPKERSKLFIRQGIDNSKVDLIMPISLMEFYQAK